MTVYELFLQRTWANLHESSFTRTEMCSKSHAVADVTRYNITVINLGNILYKDA